MMGMKKIRYRGPRSRIQRIATLPVSPRRRRDRCKTRNVGAPSRLARAKPGHPSGRYSCSHATGFAGLVAGCAICEITATGFIATEANAQGAPATTSGLNRKLLSRMDGPTAGYETIVMEVEIEPGVLIGRHTHPGIESGYVVSGD